MLIRVCLSGGGLALLYALIAHFLRNKRVSGGIVLAAAMLTLQAIVNSPIEHVIAQQLDEESEEGTDDGEQSLLEYQMQRHATRIRRGEAEADLKLRLPGRRSP